MNKEHYLALYEIARGSLASNIEPAIASVLLDEKLVEYKGDYLNLTLKGEECLHNSPKEVRESIVASHTIVIGEFPQAPPDRLVECPVCKDFYEVVCISGGVIAHCPLCRDVRSVTPYRAVKWMCDWFRQTTGREPVIAPKRLDGE